MKKSDKWTQSPSAEGNLKKYQCSRSVLIFFVFTFF